MAAEYSPVSVERALVAVVADESGQSSWGGICLVATAIFSNIPFLEAAISNTKEPR